MEGGLFYCTSLDGKVVYEAMKEKAVTLERSLTNPDDEIELFGNYETSRTWSITKAHEAWDNEYTPDQLWKVLIKLPSIRGMEAEGIPEFLVDYSKDGRILTNASTFGFREKVITFTEDETKSQQYRSLNKKYQIKLSKAVHTRSTANIHKTSFEYLYSIMKQNKKMAQRADLQSYSFKHRYMILKK